MEQNEYGIDKSLVIEFIDESLDTLNQSINLFIVLEKDSSNKDAINTIFRAVHTVKGNSAFFNLLKVKSLAHKLENVMNMVRNDTLDFTKTTSGLMISGIDMLKSMLDSIRNGNSEVPSVSEYDTLTGDITEFLKNAENIKKASPLMASQGVEKQGTELLREKTAASDRTMRVSETSIDRFLDFVGELVTVGEMYSHLEARMQNELGSVRSVNDLRKNNVVFSNLSINLQKSVLDIRKVPLKAIFQRAPRIVHDIADAGEKKVAVEVFGDDIKIDKSLLESIDAPFIHLLRNSVDHGIEPASERKRNGKSEEGRVVITAKEDDHDISIEIQDDGGGINTEAIKRKAVEKGLLTWKEATAIRDKDIFDYIFMPGFSTAKVVTDVSGRGVGMDVVKNNIEAIGGKVLLESTPQKGTKFTLIFPKSVVVKIIEGFLIRIAEERFVLPMSSVGESFTVIAENITEIPGKGECILHHGKIFPIMRLGRFTNMADKNDKQEFYVGIIILTHAKQFVMIVDEVLGIQQVVIKNVEGLSTIPPYVSGTCILGDEKVACVLDPEKL